MKTRKSSKSAVKNDPYQPLDDHYHEVVEAANEFVRNLITSDNQFMKEESNDIYLEGMIVGWIFAQPWFPEMETAIRNAYAREDILHMVHDHALQAAADAIGNIGTDAIGTFSANYVEEEVAVKALKVITNADKIAAQYGGIVV